MQFDQRALLDYLPANDRSDPFIVKQWKDFSRQMHFGKSAPRYAVALRTNVRQMHRSPLFKRDPSSTRLGRPYRFPGSGASQRLGGRCGRDRTIGDVNFQAGTRTATAWTLISGLHIALSFLILHYIRIPIMQLSHPVRAFSRPLEPHLSRSSKHHHRLIYCLHHAFYALASRSSHICIYIHICFACFLYIMTKRHDTSTSRHHLFYVHSYPQVFTSLHNIMTYTTSDIPATSIDNQYKSYMQMDYTLTHATTPGLSGILAEIQYNVEHRHYFPL